MAVKNARRTRRLNEKKNHISTWTLLKALSKKDQRSSNVKEKASVCVCVFVCVMEISLFSKQILTLYCGKLCFFPYSTCFCASPLSLILFILRGCVFFVSFLFLYFFFLLFSSFSSLLWLCASLLLALCLPSVNKIQPAHLFRTEWIIEYINHPSSDCDLWNDKNGVFVYVCVCLAEFVRACLRALGKITCKPVCFTSVSLCFIVRILRVKR